MVVFGSMKRDVNELWQDPKNWTGIGYRCPEDPRLMVPKRRPGLGWTFNWAHPGASRWFVGLLASSLWPTLALIVFVLIDGTRDRSRIGGLAVATVLVTIVSSLIVTLLARRVS
jgi:hypothetical protein